ncbi:hypothetical protein CBR_g78849 [Chara braunii]|uniref:Myb-like domain-containing protein n=1 Tax=Chara braunii TaxID=69332 RepID=A0A388KAI1_CHABU|nr:hypothetical protein CBR_g78849 [Chara braunii]|eukprot:GBG67068.1 hypothetical protein CBR_g78849 [Chara braunii]
MLRPPWDVEEALSRRGGGDLDDVDERLLWAEQRRELREGREEAIRWGVERLRMDRQAEEVEEPDAGLPSEEDDDNNEEGGDGNGGHASPSKNSDMGGKGGKTQAKSGNGRGRPKKAQAKPNDGYGDDEAEEKRNFWSVEHIIALIRAKRDQDAHLQGMGHAYGRMKAREWKWNDVARRLKNVVERKERASKGFNFNMDRAVYDEIEGSTGFNETMNPKNVADTGASRGVRLPSTSNGDPEAVGDADAGAGGDDEEEGSTRGSSHTMGSPGAFGKRKSTRQQTFEAMTDCMEKHGVFGREVESDWVDEEERQEEDADFQEEEEHTLKRKVKPRTRGAMRIKVGAGDAAKVAHDQPQTPSNKWNQQPVGVASSSEAVIDVSVKQSLAPQPRGEAVPVVREVADSVKAGNGRAVGEDDEALVKKLRGQRAEAKAMEVATKLWTDDIRFWNHTRGHEIIQIMHEARVYLVDVATGVQPSPIRRSIKLPHSSIPQKTIEDGSELRAAKERALKVETIAKRAIYGWISSPIADTRGITWRTSTP